MRTLAVLAAGAIALAPTPALAQLSPGPVSPPAAAAYALLLPGLAYAAIPLTGGASVVLAPALAGGGHLAAGAPGRGLAVGLAGGLLGLSAYSVGTAYLQPYGPAAGVQAAAVAGVPFVLWAAWDAWREAASRQPLVLPEEPPLPPISQLHYRLLFDGMPLGKVVDLLGRSGRRMDRSRAGGRVAETWRWTNPDGSYLEVSFQGDQLVGKAQRALPER